MSVRVAGKVIFGALVGAVLLVVNGCMPDLGTSVPGDEGGEGPDTEGDAEATGDRRGSALRVEVRVGRNGVMALVDAVQVDEQVLSSPGDIEILDESGLVLATAAVPDPRLHSIIAPPGEQGGDAVLFDEAYVEVLVPWPEGATAISLGSDRIESPQRLVARPKDGDEPTAEPVLVSGPASERFDVVILADGYTEIELAHFDEDVERIVDRLIGVEPYASYLPMLNIWKVPRPSVHSGAGRGGLSEDTAYGCYYDCNGIHRLLCCDSPRVSRDAREAVPSMNAVIVIVNDDEYGGAGSVAYGSTYNGYWAPNVAVHELGHVLGLRDEYSYGTTGSLPAGSPNCAESASATPWEPWRSLPGVDAFATCSHTNHYRPTDAQCMMNVINWDGYCPVCREQVLLGLYESTAGPIVHISPEPDWYRPIELGDEPLTVGVETIGPTGETLELSWALDGEALEATGLAMTLEACALGSDSTLRELEVTVHDPTDWIRDAFAARVTHSVRWWLTGSAACEVIEPDDPVEPDDPAEPDDPVEPDDPAEPDDPPAGGWGRTVAAHESEHPYRDYFDGSFDVVAPAGAEAMRIHFSRIDVESGYDFVEVYDAAGTQVHRFTGEHSDLWTDELVGATARIRLSTDYSVTRWGFAVDAVESRGALVPGGDWTSTAVDMQSAHPYLDRTDDSRDVAGAAGLSEMRLRFARIEVESGYDFVEVYDTHGTLVERLDGTLVDHTTPVFDGPNARVRLVTDSSITGWGYHLDRIDQR